MFEVTARDVFGERERENVWQHDVLRENVLDRLFKLFTAAKIYTGMQ